MKCRYCEKNARVNVQKAWIKWDYEPKTDSYSNNHELLLDAEEPVGDENLHLCESCFDKWKRGDLDEGGIGAVSWPPHHPLQAEVRGRHLTKS